MSDPPRIVVIFGYGWSSAGAIMKSDPHTTRAAASDAPPAASGLERRRFVADLNALELRLAIIDDRFERLAARPERDYREWRADTVARMRALAEQAGRLQRAASLQASQRDRVAAVLATLRHRLAAIERRRAAATGEPRRRGAPIIGRETDGRA
jgi:hypothetical protein